MDVGWNFSALFMGCGNSLSCVCRLMREKKRGIVFPLFLLFLLPLILKADFVVANNGILPEKTIKKIEEMGEELYKKTQISVYLAVFDTFEDMKEKEKEIISKVTPPYALLIISLGNKKIDIVSSKDIEECFNKEQILSPFPWKGSILPILTARSKNFKAQVEAALLNGYADIVEQIAKSKHIELKSAIGSQNRYVYDIVKIIFYGVLILIFGNFFLKRILKYGKR
jgi:hypothetical protein